MTFQDFFSQAIAYNPTTGALVTDADFTVHAVDDASLSTSLAVTDPASGVAITSLRSSSVGVLPDMRVAGDPAQVIIKSGSFVTKITSVYGAVVQAGLDPATVAASIAAGAAAVVARDEAGVARDQAVSASFAATSAASAVEGVVATNDGIMTGVAADPGSAFSGQLNATFAGAVQRAGYRIAGGGSTTTNNSIANLHMRVPFRFPVKPKRVRVHVWNRDVKAGSGVATPGAVPFRGIWAGVSAVDADGLPTWVFESAPTQLSEGFTTAADGSTESVTPWVDVDLPAGLDLLLSFGLAATPGQVHTRSQGQAWYVSPTYAGTLTDPPKLDPGAMTPINSTWYDMWVEYETDSGVYHALTVGDSLTVGTTSTWPYRDGYGSQMGEMLGAATTVAAWHGTNIRLDWTNASPKWGMVEEVTKPTWIDVGLGTNDLANGDSLATLKTSLGGLIAKLRSIHPDVPIYVRTIMPRGFSGTQETDRLAFNAWIVGRPYGIKGIFDIATPVTDPATGNTLLAAIRAGDGVHLNTNGYRIIAAVARPPLHFMQGALT